MARSFSVSQAARSVRVLFGAFGCTAMVLAGVVVPSTQVAAQTAPIVMKMSTATLNDVQHEWYRRFGAEVEKTSGGRIKGEIYPASQLGSIPRQIEGTQFGSIQVFNGPPQFLAGIDARYEVMSAPGVFPDPGHAQRAMQDPEFNAAFLALGANRGLKGIGLFVTGPAGIATRTKVTRLADLEGRKLRVLAADMDREEMRRLKATAVPMSLGEVLPALQQGAIDGVMTSLPVMVGLRYYDAARFHYEIDHSMITVVSVMSKVWFDKLPADLQKVVLDAGQKVSREIYAWSAEDLVRAKDVWTKNGGEITPLSAEDRAAVTRMMSPIGAEITARKPEEKAMYDLLLRAIQRTAQ
jgi:TRAP-type C4-dicarboxylate transport system substrate-binding protein